MFGKMSFEEFKKQDEYCRENNTPEGLGCEGCSGKEGVCADNIWNIIGKLEKEGLI